MSFKKDNYLVNYFMYLDDDVDSYCQKCCLFGNPFTYFKSFIFLFHELFIN